MRPKSPLRYGLSTLILFGLFMVSIFIPDIFHTQPPGNVPLTQASAVGEQVTGQAVEQAPEVVSEKLPIRQGDTVDGLLAKLGESTEARLKIIAAIQKTFDVRKFRAGSELIVNRLVSGVLHSVAYTLNEDSQLRVWSKNGDYTAEIIEIPGVLRPVSLCGILQGSLFETMQKIGERPELAIEIAEIFAWDLDFYKDSREGDAFCMLVEMKTYSNGQPPSYRRILSATYENRDTTYDAFLFPDQHGEENYYNSKGLALQSGFLRSPIKFASRISSRFSPRRLHPVLKIVRPHWGTDYAAPTGTPVQTVGAGRVTFSGRSGASGNLIQIQHTNGFETQYLHLSRRLVRKGERVKQGQDIGLVGATGLATGPHLDIRVRKNGKYLDFQKLRTPRTRKIPEADMARFRTVQNGFLALLNQQQLSPSPIVATRDSKPQSQPNP
jgi:murein DD-endopeptidase MepM/ murein hydrolase activator NlpD